MSEVIDIAIIGGGPAGLTAALYAARARAETVVFESAMPGGQIITTDWIENYPGMPEGLSGSQIGELMHAQAEKWDARFHTFSKIVSLRSEKGGFILTSEEGDEFAARAVVLATGAVPRKLGIPGEAEYTGRGVSWCATCDAPLYRDKVVAVVGGGDAAVEEALHLTKFAARVHLIHRRDELRATKCIQERCFANEKIEMHWNRVPSEILGREGRVSAVRLESTNDEPEESLELDGVFEFIGVHPNNELADGLCELTDGGWVHIDGSCSTTVPGLYAAGDVTDTPLKQVVTAAGQGATAAFEALRHLDTGVCTL